MESQVFRQIEIALSKSDCCFAVFMGVAGCGKSSAASAVAERLGWRLVEGDDFPRRSQQGQDAPGIALDDQDRARWLAQLGDLLAQHQRSGDRPR